MDSDGIWSELTQCVADFDLRGVNEDDVDDILTQKFQMLSESHKNETYNCLDALSTERLERTVDCFTKILKLIDRKPSMANAFWKAMGQINRKRVMHRRMLATLDLCMSQVSALAKTINSSPTEAQSPLSKGLLAATIYLMWLHIPGGSAYSVFMPFVFQDSLWVLLNWAKLMYAPEVDHSNTSATQSGQTKRKQPKKIADKSYKMPSDLALFGKKTLEVLASHKSMDNFSDDAILATLDAVISISTLMALQGEPDECCRQILLALYPSHGQEVLGRLIPALTVRDKTLQTGTSDKSRHMQNIHSWSLSTTDQLLRSTPDLEENARNAVCILQQLCIRSPEKTEDRKRVVAALVLLLNNHVLPHSELTNIFIGFLESYSRSEKVVCRQFAVETFSQLIIDDTWTNDLSKLFGGLLQRTRDRSVWVRTKALAGLTAMLSKSLGQNGEKQNKKLELSVTAELSSSKMFDLLDMTRPQRVWNLLLDLLKERLDDEKKIVRKYALQALEILLVKEPDMDVVADVQLKCTDSSLLVRKQAIQVLTSLLLNDPTNEALQNIWNWGILPLINDPEIAVQTCCVDLIEQVFFSRLRQWYQKDLLRKDDNPKLTAVHTQFHQLDRMLISFFQSATRLLLKNKKLDLDLVIKNCLQGIQDELTEGSSWVILDELRSHLLDRVSVSECRQLTKIWQTKQGKNDYTLQMLRVISAVAPRVPTLDASKIAAGLQKSLQEFTFPMNVIRGAVEALGHLKKKEGWIRIIWSACDDYLQATSDSGIDDVTKLQKVLCTMGDLWDTGEFHQARLQSIHRYMLPQFNQSQTPPSVRAIAFLALGKVCLANEEIAKKSMTIFIRELETSNEVVIRSNILLILGDLCMQYTSIVEVYVPTIAACFLNPDVLLRRNVLLMLTQLILQGYIKWKDSLLHFFLHLVVDENKDLAHLARHVLSGSLLKKTPNLFTTKFVETIFVLNAVDLPPTSASHGISLSIESLKALSLPGINCFPKRLKIYEFMLETMSDFQKVDVTGKITRGILEEISEQKLPLHANPSEINDNSVERVLQDALLVLSSPGIKLNVRDDGGDEEDEQVMSSMKDATRKLASKLSKKNLMVNVIPVVIGVKHQLEAKRSPVMRYLLHYIQDLMVSYKEEVTEVLNTDPQLAKEIAFDLKQFKSMQLARSRVSFGGNLGPAPTTSGGVGSTPIPATPQLKKNMTPLTRVLRGRTNSDADSDDEDIRKTLDFSAPPAKQQQPTPLHHIHSIVDPPSVIEEEEELSSSAESSPEETFEKRKRVKKVAPKKKATKPKKKSQVIVVGVPPLLPPIDGKKRRHEQIEANESMQKELLVHAELEWSVFRLKEAIISQLKQEHRSNLALSPEVVFLAVGGALAFDADTLGSVLLDRRIVVCGIDAPEEKPKTKEQQDISGAINHLQLMGFSTQRAKEALKVASNNLEGAVAYLTEGVIPQISTQQKTIDQLTDIAMTKPYFLYTALQSYNQDHLIGLTLDQVKASIERRQEDTKTMENDHEAESKDEVEIIEPADREFVYNEDAFLQAHSDNAAVERLQALGFSKEDAFNALIACDRNENDAANLLLESLTSK